MIGRSLFSLFWRVALLLVAGIFYFASVSHAAEKTIIKGMRLQKYNTDGSMGVVKDTVFLQCFWPVTDSPIQPFADGSSGICVEGPPTPRNIVFPDDTIFSWGTKPVYFNTVTDSKPVTKEVMATKPNVEVEPGKFKDVTYADTVTVTEPVREVTEIPKPKWRNIQALKAAKEVKSK